MNKTQVIIKCLDEALKEQHIKIDNSSIWGYVYTNYLNSGSIEDRIRQHIPDFPARNDWEFLKKVGRDHRDLITQTKLYKALE